MVTGEPTCTAGMIGTVQLLSIQRACLPMPLLCRHGVPVLDSYEASLQLYNSHVTVPQSIAGSIDCLHFCRPSLGEVRGQHSTAATESQW
jgi:hypothetical protein